MVSMWCPFGLTKQNIDGVHFFKKHKNRIPSAEGPFQCAFERLSNVPLCLRYGRWVSKKSSLNSRNDGFDATTIEPPAVNSILVEDTAKINDPKDPSDWISLNKKLVLPSRLLVTVQANKGTPTQNGVCNNEPRLCTVKETDARKTSINFIFQSFRDSWNEYRCDKQGDGLRLKRIIPQICTRRLEWKGQQNKQLTHGAQTLLPKWKLFLGVN